MPQVDNRVFRTKHLKHASVLRSCPTVKLGPLERDGRDAVFCFSPYEESKKIIDSYFSDDLQLSPRVLFESWENLKDLIYYRQAQGQEPEETQKVRFREIGGNHGNKY